MEHLFIREEGDSFWADGLTVGIDNEASYRVLYTIRFNQEWKARQVRLTMSGRVNNTVDMFIDEDGRWTAFFEEENIDIYGCFAIEISNSPVTRSLVARQLTLSHSETMEIRVASFSIIDLKLKSVTFRYNCLQAGDSWDLYRCENLDTRQEEDLLVDKDGLLIDAPSQLKRIWVG